MFNTWHNSGQLLRRTAAIALLLAASANLSAQHSKSISVRASEAVLPVTTAAMEAGRTTAQAESAVGGTIKPPSLVPTAAHIDETAAGKNAPPIVAVTTNADRSFTVPPNANPTDAQHSSYMACMLYMNVPSAQDSEGEIRAHLQRTGSPTRP